MAAQPSHAIPIARATGSDYERLRNGNKTRMDALREQIRDTGPKTVLYLRRGIKLFHFIQQCPAAAPCIVSIASIATPLYFVITQRRKTSKEIGMSARREGKAQV